MAPKYNEAFAMKFFRFALVCVALAVIPATAPAQLQYAWGDSSGNPITSANVNALNGTVTLRVYVQDLSSGASVFNSQGGLGSASVKVTGVTGSANVTAGSPDTGTGKWEFGDTNSSNPPTSINLNVLNASAGRLPDASGRVLLGTVTLQGVSAGTFNVTAADPFPGNSGDVTLFANGQTLDPLTTATLQLIVVPEPTGLLFAAVGVMTFVRRRKFLGALSLVGK
jgi:hypothetical protein